MKKTTDAVNWGECEKHHRSELEEYCPRQNAKETTHVENKRPVLKGLGIPSLCCDTLEVLTSQFNKNAPHLSTI
jgi:hypothetical protein